MARMLYHVYVELRDPLHDSETKLGLSEGDLKRRILRPYREGRAFVLNGRPIEPSNILRLNISCGETPVEQLMARADAEDRASSVYFLDRDIQPYLAFGYCENVTDRFIDGPPGSGRGKRRRKQRSPAPKIRKNRGTGKGNDPLSVDMQTLTVSFKGHTHKFTERRTLLFSLMARLARSRGRLVSFANLRDKGGPWEGVIVTGDTIKSALSRLRITLRKSHMSELSAALHVRTVEGAKYAVLDL